jgi:hypothetical protein
MTVDGIRLILRLARGDTAGIARCLGTRTAWPGRLVEDALAGGLGIVLFRALPSLPPGFPVPAGQLAALERQQRRQEQRSTRLLDRLADIADRFADAGQAFILLKGVYLAERYYGDLAGREFIDLDLLVPMADRRRASRALESAGYAMRSRTIGGEAVTSFFVHGFDFVAGKINLDLHWRLSRHPSLRVDEARLWNERRAYVIKDREYAVLSDEHELVFQALALVRDIERGRPKTKNVIDIVQVAAAADATLNWDAVLERARTEGTQGQLVNVLSLCLDVTDARDLTPRLSAALDGQTRPVRVRSASAPFVFEPLSWGLGNKWWSARVHDTTPLGWLLWWMVSLPFRLGVHYRPARPSATSGASARS